MNDTWTIHGTASIDQRGPVDCALTICADGAWTADLATFTLAGNVDLLFTSAAGGRFCGPAFVERSRADTEPLRARTLLSGAGPLLVMAAGFAADEIGTGEPQAIDGQLVLEAS